MAAATSSSYDDDDDDDVVFLGEPDKLDEATRKLFLSDGGDSGAAAALSSPAAEAIASTLSSQADLHALCNKHGIPQEHKPVCASHAGRRASHAPPRGSDAMCVYAAALDAGLRFPLHEFYPRVLRHYNLAPSQLSPNAWSYLAAFVLLCKEAGVEPLVSAFRYFFTICAQSAGGRPTGWHHFQPYTDKGRRLFTGSLPSRSGWKSKYFFLEALPGKKWTCPVKWGKPRRENARNVELTSTAVEKLKNMAAGGIDLRSFLNKIAGEMPVGDLAALMPTQTTVKAETAAVSAAETDSAATRKRKLVEAALASPQTVGSFAGSTQAAGFTPVTGGVFSTSNAGRSSTQPSNLPRLQDFLAGSSSSGSPLIRGFINNGDPSTPAPTQSSGQPLIRSSMFSNGDSNISNDPLQQHSFAHTGAVNIGGLSTGDALLLWEAITARDEQAAKVAKLNEDLQMVTAWNVQYQKELKSAGERQGDLTRHLRVATQQHKLLKEEHARLKTEYVAERSQLICHLRAATVEVERLQSELATSVARLKEEHAAEIAQLKEELTAENARVREELEAEVAQLTKDHHAMGNKKKTMLSMHPNATYPSGFLDYYDDMGCSPLRGEDQ